MRVQGSFYVWLILDICARVRRKQRSFDPLRGDASSGEYNMIRETSSQELSFVN